MKKIIYAAWDLIDTLNDKLNWDNVDNHEIMIKRNDLEDMLKDTKLGEDRFLVDNICEHLGIEEFPGKTKNMANTMARVFYFAIMFRQLGRGALYLDNGDEIMRKLNRDRAGKYYYMKMIRNDKFMRNALKNFMEMYQYESELI